MGPPNEVTARRGISVSKRDANRTLQLLSKHNLLDSNLQPTIDGERIIVPLNEEADGAKIAAILSDIQPLMLVWWTFALKKRRKDIHEILAREIPVSILSKIPPPTDIIGDVAIIEISDELRPYRDKIAKAILQVNKRLRSVLQKSGPISGDFRVRELEHLAGKPQTETMHKEFGLRFLVDPTRVYFTPRLANEHARIAGIVHEGEMIVDMFTGVGPFAIAIASRNQSVKVVAIDWNTSAIEYLNRNIVFNNVTDKVEPRLGDAKEIISPKLLGRADRVIMNLPERSEEFLPAAISTLKPKGGIIHFYCFAGGKNPEAEAVSKLQTALEKIHESTEIERVLRIRETAPYEWQMVVDARVRPRPK